MTRAERLAFMSGARIAVIVILIGALLKAVT
jgi:hypothetical protein